MSRIVTLTSDFGLADHYVASVKGVILSLNPGATIVDITHDVSPHRVKQGLFLLECALPYFPPGTIHVAVIDPGVGSDRRALVVSNGTAVFVGPDNGLLSCALPDSCRDLASEAGEPVEVPAGIDASILSDSRFHRPSVSRTFHGRDIFAPVAAHLSLGVPLADFGSKTDFMIAFPPFRASLADDGTIVGEAIHIDRFGNAITTIRADQVPSGGVTVEVNGHRLERLARTYSDLQGSGVLIGSAGFLEIATAERRAADALDVKLGDQVVARAA
jgi:S-adenosyl-L-methionine hydrolase (adenosine-forming)